MHRLSAWSIVAVLGAFALGAGALVWDDDERKLARGQELLASGKPAEAAAVLAQVEGDPGRSVVSLEAALLRSHALRLAEQPRQAAEAARRLLESLPEKHPARGRTRHLLAAAAEALGEEDRAARLWGEEAARVLGDGHRARVAGYYLDLAARFEKEMPSGDPVKPPHPAEPARAAAMRLEALKLLSGGKPLAGVTIPRANNLLDARQAGPAVSELDTLLKQKDLAPKVAAEARFALARALQMVGNPARAREELARLLAIKDVDETPFAAPARYLLGEVSLAAAPGGPGLQQAVTAWRAFLAKHPDHQKASAARRAIASAYFNAGEAADAIPALDAVAADTAAKDEHRAEARFNIGLCHRHLAHFDKARDAFRRFLQAHPDDRRVPQAQAMLPELLLEKARRRRALKDPKGAVGALRQYLEEFPLSQKAAAVAVEIGLVLRAAKDKDGASRAFASARTRYKSHDRNQAARAGLLLGIVAEEDQKDLEEAITAYRAVVKDFRGTAAAGEAATRIATLEKIELRLSVPRMFRPGEPARAKLFVRNVPQAQIRIYKLDARQVFDRRGSLDGVQDIEVALVKPDRSFDFPTPDYARYRRDEVDLTLEIAEGKGLPEGAWLVGIQAERRRSVALVLVSSVRVVVKESPHEVFCWAVDAVSGEPVKDVEILVRGTDVKSTLKTAADGTARLIHDEPRGRCRVLALRGASVAPGLAQAPPAPDKAGLAPRAAFTLDRPIYRPGSTVRWQAVLRDVKAGAFVTPKAGTEVTAWLQRARRIAETKVTCGAFGTVSGSFELPAEAAVGDWTLGITFGSHTFQETVPVQAYRKPEYEVAVKAKKPVVRPGDEVDVGVDVSYFFGGPVREAAFDWRVWRAPASIDRSRYVSHAWYLRATQAERGARPQPGMTFVGSGSGSLDSKGHGAFTFRTPLDLAPQRYVVQVMVRDSTNQWVSGTGQVWSGTSDRFAVTLADRRTYRAGDTAEVRIITRSLGHAPVGTSGRARAFLERVAADGTKSLEPRTEAAVDTGIEGEAKVRLALEEAGDWVIRFEGKDAHDAPVVDETRVVVTGERPDLKKEAHLRFEKAAYRGGEAARMHLWLPTAGRPVLLTFEGERILGHRIIRPKTTSAVEELVLDASLAPNVVVACAMPFEEKLLTSQDHVVVLRYLQVGVQPDKKRAAPGDKLTVEVTTRDQMGKPVAAALALSVVDRALKNLGGNPGQDPRFVFNRDVRRHLVKTTSSYAFSFDGEVLMLDRDLLRLREEERRMRDRARFGREKNKGPGTESRRSFFRGLTDPEDSKAQQEGAGAGLGYGVDAAAQPRPQNNVRMHQAMREGRDNRMAGGKLPNLARVTPPKADRGGGDDGLPDKPAEEPVLKDAEFASRVRFSAAAGEMEGIKWGQAVAGADVQFDAVNGIIGLGGGAGGQFGAVAMPASRAKFLEVAAWKPDLITDASGKASFSFELPDNLTSWEARAGGTTAGVSVGAGAASFEVHKDVILRITTPRFVTSRDRMALPVTLHSNLSEEATFVVELELKDTDAASLHGTTRHEATVGARGRHGHPVDLQARAAGVATVTASALSQAGSDAVEASVSVIPFGEPWRHVDVREIVDRCDFTVAVPDGAVAGSQIYRVVVQAGVGADVLEGVEFCSGYPYGCVEQTVNRFLPSLILARALANAGRPPIVDADRLKEQVERGITRLFAFQNDDGGFGYWPGGGSSPWTTALVLEALVHARDAGYAIPPAMLQFAQAGALALLKSTGRDADARATLVLALARSDKPDANAVSALFRDRRSLSVRGLSRLLLAASASGRPGFVSGILRELRARRRPGAQPYHKRAHATWPSSDLEANALALLAELAADDGTADLSALVATVRAGIRRRDGGTKAVAIGVEALAKWVADEGALRSTGDVKVLVDGTEVASGRLDGRVPVRTFDIPAERLGAGDHKVTVTKNAGDAATCRLLLTHVKDAESVTPAGNIVDVRRRVIAYQDPDRTVAAFAPGYDVVKPESRPRPEDPPALGQTVIGSKVTVELVVTAREDTSWLVVEDPQCAGLEAITTGVRGAHDRFERRSTRLLFFKNRLRAGETLKITYPCYAVHRGSFSILPAGVHEMYAPERWGRSGSAGLEVVPDASMLASVPPAKATPDELWAAARRDWTKTEYEKVVANVAELRVFDLRDDILDQALALLIRACLRTDEWSEAVRARDELNLRNPGKLRLTRADRERLGRAYLAVNDALSARSHFESVILDALEEELRVADSLRGAKRPDEAYEHERRTLLRYPAIPYVVGKKLDLAGKLMSLPDTKRKDRDQLPPRHRVRWGEAMATWRSLMAWTHGTSLAEEANYRRVILLAELGMEDALIQESRRYLERHGRDVRRADAVTFRLTVALFGKGDYDASRPLAKEVWDTRWPKSAEKGELSQWRARAGYLLGRMAHVAGDYDDAVTWYGRVRQKVPDAEQSWRFFTEKVLVTPAVHRADPDSPVKLQTRSKNVEELELQVFPVDLGVLFAVKKSFARLGSAELSGLVPAKSMTEKPGLAKYTEGEATIDLGKLDRGAYLVVMQSGDRSAQSLVLVGDASLTLQRGGGAIRVYLVDGAGKPVRDAQVHMSRSSQIFHTGKTDERGMLDVRDPGRGEITVVAEKEAHVAVATHR